jgi:hypothetical protein
MFPMSTEQAMVNYHVAQEQRRKEQSERILSTLTERERELVKEAAVMGYALGVKLAGGLPNAMHPKDSEVLQDVLLSCRSHSDLYPVIGTLDAS